MVEFPTFWIFFLQVDEVGTCRLSRSKLSEIVPICQGKMLLKWPDEHLHHIFQSILFYKNL